MLKREIGSEFWDIPRTEKKNKLFPESVQWFLSGRSALTAIIRDIKKKWDVRTVAMPSWCCDSMIIPFLREGIDVQFYSVYLNGELKQDINKSYDALFLMDYFGYTNPKIGLEDYEGIVIRDVTHSLFSHSYSDADYYFGSLRKWCGIITGGYAWGSQFETGSEDVEFIKLRSEAMREKYKYINGEIDRKDYLKQFEKAEEHLDELKGVYVSQLEDIKAAQHIDITKIQTQRRKNASVLMEALKSHLIFSSLSIKDCPIFVPIIVPDGMRDSLRRYLIKHEIYCPVHWPISQHHRLVEKDLYIYNNELSLICDQRYSEEDMCRMVEIINKFWKGDN